MELVLVGGVVVTAGVFETVGLFATVGVFETVGLFMVGMLCVVASGVAAPGEAVDEVVGVFV